MPTATQIHELASYVFQASRHYWKLAACVFAAGVALSFVGTFMMPRSYYSEARLFVRFGRENQVDLTATGGQMVSVNESRESEINSLIEILKSRSILDRVVNELGPDYILHGQPLAAGTKAPATAFPQRSRTTLEPPSPAHLRAIQQLERRLSVWTPRKSNIIEIAYKADSPAIAQQIVARLVEVYLHEHVRVHHTAGTYEFFQQQQQLSLQQWQAAAQKLGQAKDRLGIVTIDGKRRELESQVADVAARLQANQAELRAAEAKIASLEQLIGELPAMVVTQETQSASAAFDGMRQTLYSLEAREQDLASKMQSNHPQLAAVRQQVSDLRRILDQQPMQRVQATEAMNPNRQALSLALLNEQSQEDSLQGRGRELLALQQRLQAELVALNGQEGNLLQLQQAADLAESRHSEYAQKLEQARLNRSLDEERISSLVVFQPASYVDKPVGPRRLYLLAIALFLTTLSGLGSALAAAYLNPRLLSATDVPELLGLPLAGILPRQSLHPAC